MAGADEVQVGNIKNYKVLFLWCWYGAFGDDQYGKAGADGAQAENRKHDEDCCFGIRKKFLW